MLVIAAATFISGTGSREEVCAPPASGAGGCGRCIRTTAALMGSGVEFTIQAGTIRRTTRGDPIATAAPGSATDSSDSSEA